MGRKKKVLDNPESVEKKSAARTEEMDNSHELSQNDLNSHPKFAKFKSKPMKGLNNVNQ
jgi:hypothetical protein